MNSLHAYVEALVAKGEAGATSGGVLEDHALSGFADGVGARVSQVQEYMRADVISRVRCGHVWYLPKYPFSATWPPRQEAEGTVDVVEFRGDILLRK